MNKFVKRKWEGLVNRASSNENPGTEFKKKIKTFSDYGLLLIIPSKGIGVYNQFVVIHVARRG